MVKVLFTKVSFNFIRVRGYRPQNVLIYIFDPPPLSKRHPGSLPFLTLGEARGDGKKCQQRRVQEQSLPLPARATTQASPATRH